MFSTAPLTLRCLGFAMLAALVAAMRALQAAQARSRQRLDDLYQSLLDRAFNGQL